MTTESDRELLELAAKAAQELAELRADLAICRDAIEQCFGIVQALDCYSDADSAAQQVTLRRLNEAVGKATPRLLYERSEGQKLYGLRWRELTAELAAETARADAAEAERDILKADVLRSREHADALVEAEHSLSRSYVRIREIIGAMDPPRQLGVIQPREVLWTYVEQVARDLVAERDALRAELAALRAQEPVGEAFAVTTPNGYTAALFFELKVPAGAKLYAHPVPAQPAADPWKDTVEAMLSELQATVGNKTPRQAIDLLLDWHESVALDPLVSSEARALVQRGRDEVLQPAADAQALRDAAVLARDSLALALAASSTYPSVRAALHALDAALSTDRSEVPPSGS